MMYKNLLAVVLLVYSVFGLGWLDILDQPFPKPQPEPTPAKIIDVNTPSAEVERRVNVFSEIVTDPSDRAKVAIFNYEFANRVISYEADSQQVNDIYTLAGKTFFETTLLDKYDGLSENIVYLLQECIGDDNHVLSPEEKNKLNEYFMGVAWALIQTQKG